MKHLFTLKSFHNGVEVYSFDLTQNKLLIGSDNRCDIVLDDNSISSYHAMLILNDESVTLLDLHSINGIVINDERIKEGTICSGDTITLGNITFILEETYKQNITITSLDKNVTTVQVEQPATIMRPIEGLTVIDDEYCNITFTPQESKAVNLDLSYLENSYIDFDEEPDFTKPVLANTTGKYLQVELSVAGNCIDTQIRKLKDKIYFIGIKDSSTMFNLEGLTLGEEKIALVESQGEILIPQNIETFEQSTEDNHIIFQRGDTRITVSVVENIPTTRWAPFFEFDRYFQKINAKTMGSILGFALLLLLIDTSLPPKPKKVAIIYKLQKKVAKKMKANDPVNNNSNPGQNSVDAPPKQQIAAQKRSTSKKKIKHKMKPVKVAKQKTHKPIKKKTPIRTYKFKSSHALSSFLKHNTKINIKTTSTTNNTSTTIATSATTVENIAYKGVRDIKSRRPGSISRRGSLNSLGGRGLISKEGIDTSFATTKTVVLGSMDPELLRKILRRYLPQFRQCYQQELLKQNSKLEGVISLDFRIGKRGRVIHSNIYAKKAQFSKTGTNCMNRVLSLIKFPKPRGGGFVDVTQPLNFYAEREIIN